MNSYDLEVKKLDKMISDLEAKLTVAFDPAFHELLQRFKALRDKYQHLSEASPRLRSRDAIKPYWSNQPPDGR
jgi:hypothetical protein